MTVQKKPNPVLFAIGSTFVQIRNHFVHRLKVSGDKVHGPALILANHTSNEDYMFVSATCWPRGISFLVTYHFFTFRFLGKILKMFRCIPKLQFATDLDAIKKMKYILEKENGIVYMAPEGTVYANGKLGYISPATAKLIKYFKVPVYASKIQGAGLGNAKWSAHLHRDFVSIDTHLLFTAEQTKSLKPDTILKKTIEALTYNEFDYQKQNNIHIKGTDLAEGFETMFYKCPVCDSEFTLKTYGNTVECTKCGAKAHLGSDFRFRWSTKKRYFNNYIQWYDWQYSCVRKEWEKPDFSMQAEVDYAIDKPGINNYVKVGHGTMTLDHNGWTYNGTFEGKEIEEHDDLTQVFLATLKKGIHFELPYRFGHCRAFYPSNGLESMKWHLISRAISERD